MKRSWRLKVPAEKVAEVAAKLVHDHADMLGRGFRLMGSSAIWQTKAAGLTARLVYRSGDGKSTFTYIFSNIR